MAAAATPKKLEKKPEIVTDSTIRVGSDGTDLRTQSTENNNGPAGSMLGRFYCRLSIGKYERQSPFTDSSWRPHSMLYLPLPDVLKDSTAAKYGGMDLETVGDFFNMDFATGVGGALYRNAGTAISTGVGNLSGAALSAMIAAASGGKASGVGDKLGAALNKGMQNTFPGDKIQSAIEQKFGVAPNPNPSVAFQGPELRNFSYTWTFYPTKKEESAKVFNIIKLLKQASLPAQTFSGSGALLNYPDICQLNFFPWDENSNSRWGWTEKSIIRIKKCFMTNVDVDYNPSNVPGFFNDENSSPVAIRLTINFSEIEYMLSQDWESGRTGSTFIEDATIIALGIGAVTAAASGNPGIAAAAVLGGAIVLSETKL